MAVQPSYDSKQITTAWLRLNCSGGRNSYWDHFSTELCNRTQMCRWRPGFYFTENGGGFDSERRGEICLSRSTFCRGKANEWASRWQKARKTCVSKQRMLQLFQKLEGMWPPKSGPKTCWQKQGAIFWDHFGVTDLIKLTDKVRTIVPESSIYFNKLSNTIKPASNLYSVHVISFF